MTNLNLHCSFQLVWSWSAAGMKEGGISPEERETVLAFRLHMNRFLFDFHFSDEVLFMHSISYAFDIRYPMKGLSFPLKCEFNHSLFRFCS